MCSAQTGPLFLDVEGGKYMDAKRSEKPVSAAMGAARPNLANAEASNGIVARTNIVGTTEYLPNTNLAGQSAAEKVA